MTGWSSLINWYGYCYLLGDGKCFGRVIWTELFGWIGYKRYRELRRTGYRL